MAQTKYRMLLGTSKKQWEELTVMDDGRMMLYFHGRDRSVTQQVTAITEGEWAGWLRSEKGSMFPGLESGKWNMMEEGRGKTEDVIETTTDNTDCTENEPVIVADEPFSPCERPEVERTVNQAKPKRQRKPRKPRAERQPSAISPQPSAISPQPSALSHQTSSTMKAVGMVAAASVALLVIYETGLLIPLGLIGLATSGLLK